MLRLEGSFLIGDGDRALLSWLEVEIVVREAGGLVRNFEVDEVSVGRCLETYS
jgi:hypothetical protein